jgi:hypothetical protein
LADQTINGAGGMSNEEQRRLQQAETGVRWRRWGPYLSERQWGTVREDPTHGENTWGAFPFDQAGYRAYRWGEEGLAGISDDKQLLCLALSLWNERDPILKERLSVLRILRAITARTSRSVISTSTPRRLLRT